MVTLNENELATINGGFSKWLLIGLGYGIVFISSIIYGIIYPNKC